MNYQLKSLQDYEIGIALVVILLLVPILTLLMRKLICWYFKIDERIKIQEEIRDHLEFFIMTSTSRTK